VTRARAVKTWFGSGFIAFCLFVSLGVVIQGLGEPAFLLSWERVLFDHSTLVAWRLTQSCYPMVLIPICVVLLVLAAFLRTWRVRILLSIVTLLISWRAADFFQHYFARPRPEMWVVKHELTFSYPSSHAAIAFGFYGLWAALLYCSNLPKGLRFGGAWLLAIFALAICWSRLALGAHYVTDLVGGALLGLATVLISVAAVVAIFGRVAGPAVSGQNRAA
jgi:membrane-associated phospholipid phosphatase